MKITKNHQVVVPVGEVIEYEGKVYCCKRDEKMTSCGCCAFVLSLCDIMACGGNDRPDGLYVHFVPFGEEERI